MPVRPSALDAHRRRSAAIRPDRGRRARPRQRPAPAGCGRRGAGGRVDRAMANQEQGSTPGASRSTISSTEPATPSSVALHVPRRRVPSASPPESRSRRATLPAMGDQIDFDQRIAAQLEVVYRTRDIKRRRALAQAALAPGPGDDVLDVGCGPGFYVVDILDIVGANGSVTGVDASAAMLAIARRKAADRPNVRLLEGQATKLPVGDGSVDRAISVQVFEYLSDVDAALAELMRVVRPGGRVVIWDIDWSTLSWHSSDAD